jgi:thymidylate synthase
LRFDLKNAFPIVITKYLNLKAVLHELLSLIRGTTNVKYLQDHGRTIWNEWADGNGNLGRTYGVQWRTWRALDGRVIDQLVNVIEQ